MTTSTLEMVARAAPHRRPFWGIALLYPDQGAWSEEEYLDLPGNHLIEFTDGNLEVLPMPTTKHQTIVVNIHRVIRDFVKPRGLGRAYVAPLPVCIADGKYREPDVIFVSTLRLPPGSPSVKKLDGADLVVEIISPGTENRERDLVQKRREYAEARISEYWIVDPDAAEIEVLTLQGDAYVSAGRYHAGEQLKSLLLSDLTLDVTEVLEGD